jgi:hypothetical protein
MPEGSTRFVDGYGPPGDLPDGHNPERDPRGRCITRMLVHNLYEMHQINIDTSSQVSFGSILSAKISRSKSHRTICRRGMHERPDIVPNFYQSRIRFPAKQLYQQRDLRHGSQGSITITNPIMEE